MYCCEKYQLSLGLTLLSEHFIVPDKRKKKDAFFLSFSIIFGHIMMKKKELRIVLAFLMGLPYALLNTFHSKKL